jgi:UPF0716 protein FxsA
VRLTFLPILLLVVPLAEIATFVLVGSKIGVLPTIGLVLLTATTGAILLRVQGFGIVSRIRADLDAGRLPGREMANGLMVFAAGLLLLMPGFITDTIGLLLFIPPVRDAVFAFFAKRVVVASAAGFRRAGPGSGAERDRRGGATIDLDPDDFHAERAPGDEKVINSDPSSPWRKPGAD